MGKSKLPTALRTEIIRLECSYGQDLLVCSENSSKKLNHEYPRMQAGVRKPPRTNLRPGDDKTRGCSRRLTSILVNGR